MSGSASDLELYEAWCVGDRHAGERLFARHYGEINRYFANKITRDHHDLTQQTFLACVVSRDDFRRASSFRTFLFGVAHKVLLRRLRDYARHDARLDLGTISAAELTPGPSTLLDRRSEHARVLDALRTLQVSYQEVLELHYWEELAAPAIAEVVGITEANVRNRLHRGRLALQRALACEEPAATAALEQCARALRNRTDP
ncbi:MAG: sigma-70 family RNA polymerase sigma factor [Myxococcales bacterium]|nr:sigma-70 family RNA polymerase sigma factor [Myxococcales bacterium]